MRSSCDRSIARTIGALLVLALIAAPAATRSVKHPAKRAVAKPAPEPVPPVPEAVTLAIRAQVGSKLKGFYAPRGYWPLWLRGAAIGIQAESLLDLLADADRDGLEPKRYDIAGLNRLIDSAREGAPDALARAELKLSAVFAQYVIDTRRPPAVKITWLDPELTPQRLRPDAVLRAAALVPDFPGYVRDMGWMSPLYVHLRAALGASPAPAADEALIRLNLDRARILPGPWTRHVVVDAASARLWYFQDGKQQGTMRVIVGAPASQTPMLAGMVRYAILKPYWNVPSDLVQNRLAPKMINGASFKGLRYQALSDWSATAQLIDPATIDWHAVAAGTQEVRVRQLPGGANAMGKMKFMFPNDLGIYLHDTPDKTLFAKPGRHLSNGCIRLEDAPRLGKWLFGKAIGATAGPPEQQLPLPKPVPVYLTYLTATPTGQGVGMLEDAYGRDVGSGR